MITREVKDLGKYTASKNSNGIRYETGMLNTEGRIAVATANKITTASTLPPGFNGSPIVDSVMDVATRFPKLNIEEPLLIYDQIIVDARTLPNITQLANLVSDVYVSKLATNLDNIYNNAPRFFAENFVNSTVGFGIYQKYFYLLTFIQYVEEHGTDENMLRMNGIDNVIAWVNTRRDPNIAYIIVGPTDNTDFNHNYVEHYNTLISASTSMEQITAYQQLTTSQTTSTDVLRILSFIMTNPNVYTKTPNEASKYTININSASGSATGVMVTTDSKNNLLFDCGYVNLGDTTEQTINARYDNLGDVQQSTEIDSVIATKKLERIFNMYSRVKILELVIADGTFVTSLDAFSKVFVVFQGVQCSERMMYNSVENNYLKIGGSFEKTSRGYEFRQDVDAVTYRSTRTKVTGFKLYISLDPVNENIIIPNEYVISVTSDDIYQHPVATNNIYSSTENTKVLLPTASTESTLTTTSTGITIDTLFAIDTTVNETSVESIDCETYLNSIDEPRLTENSSIETRIAELQVYVTTVETLIAYTSTLCNNAGNNSNSVMVALNTSLTTLLANINEYIGMLNGTVSVSLDVVTIMTDIERFSVQTIKDLILVTVNRGTPLWDYANVRAKSETLIEESRTTLTDSFNENYGEELLPSSYMTLVNDLFDGMLTTTPEVLTLKTSFAEILSAVDIDVATTFNSVYHKILLWRDSYDVLRSYVEYTTEKLSTTIVTKTNTVDLTTAYIDTTTGTINGQYFRISNLFPSFTDANGDPYTTPDEQYIIYDTSTNDLMIHNLYTYMSNTIQPIIEGSFMYSSSMGVVQNLAYTLTDTSKINNKLRFDNSYNFIVDGSLKTINGVDEWTDFVNSYTNTTTGGDITYYKSVIEAYVNGSVSNTTTTYYAVNEETHVLNSYGTLGTTYIGTYPDGFMLSTLFTDDLLPMTSETTCDDTGVVLLTTKKYSAKFGTGYPLMYYKYYNIIDYYSYISDNWELNVYLNDTSTATANNTFGDTSTFSLTVGTGYSFIAVDGLITVNSTDYSFNGLAIVNGDGAYISGVINDNGTEYTLKSSATYSNGVISGTGTVTNSAYGTFSKMTIKDYLGNDIYITKTSNGESVDVTIDNSSIDTLSLMNNVSVSDYDSSNNKITVVYTYCGETQTGHQMLVLENTTEVVSDDSASTTESMIIDMATLSVYIVNGSVVSYNASVNTMTLTSDALLEVSVAVINNDSHMVINTSDNSLVKLQEYSDTVNPLMSNCYKAFKTEYDMPVMYWSKSMYINSISHMHIPIEYTYTTIVNAPISIDTNDGTSVLYNVDSNGSLTVLSGIYTITGAGFSTTINGKSSTITYTDLYYYTSEVVSCFMSIDDDSEDNVIYIRDTENGISDRSWIMRELTLVNDNYESKYIIRIYVVEGVITKLVLCAIDTSSGTTVNVPIGEYTDGIYSQIPIYINNCEIVLNYTFDESILTKTYTFSSISLTTTSTDLIQYTINDGLVQQRKISTMIYSNIPGKICDGTTDWFIMNVSTTAYSYHPTVKYSEKSFVKPKYVDTSGRYITMAEKYNQNVTTSNVYVRTTYDIGNSSVEDLRIGNKIHPYTDHVLESVDNNLLMLGNMEKVGQLSEVAITSRNISIIPQESKMQISIEFS